MLIINTPFKVLVILFISVFNLGFKAIAQDTSNRKNQFQLALDKPAKLLKGKLINVPDSLIETINQVHLRIPSLDVDGEYAISCPIQADGTFEATVEYSMPVQEILIEIGNYLDRISVHGSVEVTLDFKSYDQTGKPTISFGGKTAAWSSYMYSYGNALESDEGKDSLNNKINNLIDNSTDTVSFFRAVDKLKSQLTGFTMEYYKRIVYYNWELTQVYRDLELVEQLWSGVPRILESYGKEC